MGGDREVPVASATAWSTHYMTPAHRRGACFLLQLSTCLNRSWLWASGSFLRYLWLMFCTTDCGLQDEVKNVFMVKWDLLFSLTQLHLRAEVFSCLQWSFKNEVLFDLMLGPQRFRTRQRNTNEPMKTTRYSCPLNIHGPQVPIHKFVVLCQKYLFQSALVTAH